MMDWNSLWLLVFGRTEWLGIDLGFWVSMGLTGLIVLLMNVFFWLLPPRLGRPSNDA